MGRIVNRTLSSAFNAFREHAQLSTKKRRGLAFWVNRTLVASFAAWRAGAAHQRTKAEAAVSLQGT